MRARQRRDGLRRYRGHRRIAERFLRAGTNRPRNSVRRRRIRRGSSAALPTSRETSSPAAGHRATPLRAGSPGRRDKCLERRSCGLLHRCDWKFSRSSSARTSSVSAPSAGTLSPSPILLPFHSIGSAGTRNGAPSALKLLTRPPGRSTWGSLNRSSGRLIGEKQMLSRSSLAERSSTSQRLITSATRGMILARAMMRSVVVRKVGSSRNSRRPNSGKNSASGLR